MSRSWFGDLLKVVFSVFLFALLFLAFVGDASAFGCGGGGLFAKIKERRQARPGGGTASAGDCGQQQAAPQYGYSYAPQFEAQPLPYQTTYLSAAPTTDIPLPAAKAGAVAVFDGKTWKLVDGATGVRAAGGDHYFTAGAWQYLPAYQTAPVHVNAPGPYFAPQPTYYYPQFGYGFGSAGTTCVGGKCYPNSR